MLALMIADDDIHARMKLSNLLMEAGYDVFSTSSAAQAIDVILKNVAKVLILGSRIDGVSAMDLLPVLKSCSPELKVIIASEEIPAPMLRRLREEGIFYYFLKPVGSEDGEEVRSVVECAFKGLDLPGPGGSTGIPTTAPFGGNHADAGSLSAPRGKRRMP